MNYIIYDLEFNQHYKIKTSEEKIEDAPNSPSLTFEIIQIGGIKLNENFEKISTFTSFINPTVHKTVHPYVQKITGITSDQLQAYEKFPDVLNKFLDFIGNPEDSILCVWGTVDIKELLRNIKFYNLPSEIISKRYIDIQYHASKYFKTTGKTRIGLKNAIELLTLPIEGDFHDAFNDAYYTCEIFKHIFQPSMKPLVYDSSNRRRLGNPHKKYKVDIDSVYKQFEKMYNRHLSEEEKNIIELAYTMGRTRQFLVEDKNK